MNSNRILIIEDNVLNLELAVDLLEANGFVVLQARTAEAGVRLAREGSPDLVLLDLSLPGMEGLCASKALRADPASRHLPIMPLAAHAIKGDGKPGLRGGRARLLPKPTEPGTIVGYG